MRVESVVFLVENLDKAKKLADKFIGESSVDISIEQKFGGWCRVTFNYDNSTLPIGIFRELLKD